MLGLVRQAGDILLRCPWVPGRKVARQVSSLGVHDRAKCRVGTLELSHPGAKPTPAVRRGWTGKDGAPWGLWKPAVQWQGNDTECCGWGTPIALLGVGGSQGWHWGGWRRRGLTLTSRLFSPIAPLASQWQMIVSTAAPCLSVCLSALCRSWPRRFLSCVAARALPTPSFGSWSSSWSPPLPGTGSWPAHASGPSGMWWVERCWTDWQCRDVGVTRGSDGVGGDSDGSAVSLRDCRSKASC